ncbi:methyltransferase family protein [Pararhodospirillum oryzae]|uniref:Membrane protein n=1 Tax=Pararhodospirillum oryzae TaxID=478448 RepID=A0A512H811_9PROT|nr:isoprenylcysteine carboxylmethyltransferase family protein [Pararhodospirillum oryzae]GEO81558.1 membrane protein [Pararhodospirillum oryzae]
MDAIVGHGLNAAAWASFGLGHSWLAQERGRRWLAGRFGPWGRVAYNAISVLHLGLVGVVGLLTLDTRPFDLPPLALGAIQALAWAGALFGLYASLYYDMGRLSGIRQVWAARQGRADEPEDEPLRLDGPHRWVRHPLYLAAFLLLWGGATSPFGLSVAAWGSAYLVIGTWFEERKLSRLYGEAYARHQAEVPAFFPWPRRTPPVS